MRRQIREMLHFSQEDLSAATSAAPSESVFGTFDLVLCRNVLIYLDYEFQDKVLAKLADTLDNEGYLILGESETIASSLTAGLEVIDGVNRIYRKFA